MSTPPEAATLATIGSVIAAFGTAMLFFRIERELAMEARGERVWIPAADWLLIGATLLCLLLVLLPIALSQGVLVPTVAVAASSVLVAGYVFAILAHYRILFRRQFLFWGRRRRGPRSNPEPSERLIIAATLLAASGTALLAILLER